MLPRKSYHALICDLSDSKFEIVLAGRIRDCKKYLTQWLACKSRSDFDLLYNPRQLSCLDDCQQPHTHNAAIKIIKLSDDIDELHRLKDLLEPDTNTTEEEQEIEEKYPTKRKITCNSSESTGKRRKDDKTEPSSSKFLKSTEILRLDLTPPPSFPVPSGSSGDNSKQIHEASTEGNLNQTLNSFCSLNDIVPISNSTPQKKNKDTSSCSHKSCEEKFDLLFERITQLENKIKGYEINNTNDPEFKAKTVIIGGKYPINKREVSIGLAKREIEKYFRHLISHGWTSEEKANHNLTGGGSKGNVKINEDKLKDFIEYCLNSWNEWHSKNDANSTMIIPKAYVDKKRKELRIIMGLICQEETKRVNRIRV